MACRPEIKIPPNPMSLLKQTPRPQQKDDYWVEEYVQQKQPSVPRDEPRRVVSPPAMSYQQSQSPPIAYQQAPSPQVQTQAQVTQMRFAPQRTPSPPEQQIRNIKLEDSRVTSPPAQNRVASPNVAASVSMTPIKMTTIEPISSPPYQLPQPTQNQQQNAGRIILSTMPSRLQQSQVEQHVS